VSYQDNDGFIRHRNRQEAHRWLRLTMMQFCRWCGETKDPVGTDADPAFWCLACDEPAEGEPDAVP
jgi:hypothetical protein